MALFPDDLGYYMTGNPMLDFLSGADGASSPTPPASTKGTASTKTNIATLPEAAKAEAERKKKQEEEEERKRKKREAEKKAALKQAAPKRDTGVQGAGALGASSTSRTSPMAPYRGLGKNPNTRIKQYGGTVGL